MEPSVLFFNEDSDNTSQYKEILDCFQNIKPLKSVNGIIKKILYINSFHIRLSIIHQYGFAIPCVEAIESVVKLSPCIEIGCGSGYWSKLIKENGGDIIATDKIMGEKSKYSKEWKNEAIETLDAEKAIEKYSDRNVLLSWPCYSKNWAAKSISKIKPGKFLIFIGEDIGGCCANDTFFEILDKDFELKEEIRIPQWFGIHDIMRIYRKK